MLGYEELENGIRSVLQPMSCMQPKQQHFFLHQLQVQHPRRSAHNILRKCMYIRRKQTEQEHENLKYRKKLQIWLANNNVPRTNKQAEEIEYNIFF
jgi:hypothetical protein